MRFTIEIAGGESEEALSLLRWLVDDAGIRGHVVYDDTASRDVALVGPAAGLVVIALEAVNVARLVLGVHQWITTRPNRITVRILAGGQSLTIEAGTAREALLDSVPGLTAGGPPGPDFPTER